MTRAGLPHSVICGSQDVCSSPQLFAAYHDLLRQIAPRHPPWTLSRLTIFLLPSSLHFSYARLVLFPSLIPVKDHAATPAHVSAGLAFGVKKRPSRIAWARLDSN